MYIPSAFQETRVQVMHDLIRSHPLGWLVTAGPGGLSASPVPFLVYPEEGPNGTLRAHLARNNAHWRDLQAATECMALFQGEQGYITPNWYPNKQVTGKVVPTWNYIAVQAWGQPVVTEDPGWLRRLLEDLTSTQERSRLRPWAVGDAPADFIAKQMEAIIGVEIPIARIEGKWKLSQNREPADRQGVVAGLADPSDPHGNQALADLVEERRREGGAG
jgi:transcriptional regulator